MGKIYMTACMKGGCAKTVTTYNLAYSLQRLGKKVLSAVDAKLRLEMGAEKMLSGILELLRDRYDAILIDTAPTLGALNINALAAANEVIITVNPQLLVMMGLQDFLKTVKKIKSRINDKLDVVYCSPCVMPEPIFVRLLQSRSVIPLKVRYESLIVRFPIR